MWFRGRGRKRAERDPAKVASLVESEADGDDGGAAVLAAVADIAGPPVLPQLPTLPVVGGGAGVSRPKAAPQHALADMWDTVGKAAPACAAAADPAPRHVLRGPDPVDVPPAPPEIAPPPRTLGAAVSAVPTAAAQPQPMTAPVAQTRTPTAMGALPVGFLVVVGGPGRGAHFALEAGVSQIGRGPDEDIPLTFGDSAIARHAHASVAFDAEACAFYVGHGGTKNMVRLNGKPVLSTEALHSHDILRVGETSLMFVALCGEAFDWNRDGGHG